MGHGQQGLSFPASGPLFLLLAVLGTARCTEGPERYTTHATQVEARVDGELPLHFAWLDEATLVTVAPFHASGARNEFTKARLDELLGSTAHLYLAVAFWRLGEADAPLHLGSDGVRVEANWPAGRIASMAPSELLPQVADEGGRALLGAMLGAGKLPELGNHQTLQLLVVLPTTTGLAPLTEVQVMLPGRPPERQLILTRALIPAQRFEEFRSEPSREHFDVVLGRATPVAEKPREGPEKEGADEPTDR